MVRVILFCTGIFLVSGCQTTDDHSSSTSEPYTQRVETQLRDSVLTIAEVYLTEAPITVTASSSPRSTGGLHDFYSEGDYWWPDSTNPDGPYIRRDGLSNPDNFSDHRIALMRFSDMVGILTSAYLLTKEERYSNAAIHHCRAWFITDSTLMNPNFLYAQAIQGRHTGRGIGIIDAIHFMEVIQSLRVLEAKGLISEEDKAGFHEWVERFLTWLTTHPYGLDEMVHPNNHGSWWHAQVALYASYVEQDSLIDACRTQYMEDLLPRQMAEDGSFPLEQARTKPYAYSLFNLDAYAMLCHILYDESHDLWHYKSPDGKSIKLAMEYMTPFLEDKSQWPLPADVMYPNSWPVAQPSFLLSAVAYQDDRYFEQWARFVHFPTVFEVNRAQPIGNPLIWLAEI